MNQPQTNRLPTESLDDYLFRLGSNKELYDLSWDKIKELMNAESQEDFGESKWRKDYAQFKRGHDYAVNNKITENEVLKDLEDKTIQFHKERFKYQDQRRVYFNDIRKESRFETLIKDELNSSIAELKKIKPLVFINPPSTLTRKSANILWSDWHVGADFSNSLNTYNIGVFRDRLQKLISKTIHYGKAHNVTDLTIGALGDFISGAIHVSTRVQSSEDVIRQIQIVSESFSESLAELSKHFERIKFINIIGNHARLISDKTQSIFKENLENLIPWYLESRLKEFENVTILKDTDGYFIDETYEYPHIYVHGDLDHVSSVAKSLPQMLGIVPRYIFCGHIHHDTVKEHGRTKVISNGSMIGVDDYAISKRVYAEPMQKMHIFDGSRIEYTIDIPLI